MKYGNMVAEHDLMFNENEVSEIDEYLMAMAKELFPELHREKIVHGLTGEEGESLAFVFTCPEWNGRSADHARVSFKGVTFTFYKQSGYLEEFKDPSIGWKKENVIKNYENAPKFQYCCYMRAQGVSIRYRCKTSEAVSPAASFTFGTDFFDMAKDLRSTFYRLKNKICHNGKFSKNKVKMHRA